LHEAKRLVAEEPNRLSAYAVEMNMLENLKRIYYFCKRMARSVVPSVTVDSGGDSGVAAGEAGLVAGASRS
jgi:hypothetical protein